MTPRHLFRIAAIAMLLPLLSACGFHLRQSQALPATLSPLRIEIADPYSGLGADLGEALRQSGLTLSEGAESGPVARLRISKDSVGLTPLTIGTSGRVQEYALRYVVEVSLTDKDGKVVLPKQEIELSRLRLRHHAVAGFAGRRRSGARGTVARHGRSDHAPHRGRRPAIAVSRQQP